MVNIFSQGDSIFPVEIGNKKWYFYCPVLRVWILSDEAIQVFELFYMKVCFSFSEFSNWDLEISIHYLLWDTIRTRN